MEPSSAEITTLAHELADVSGQAILPYFRSGLTVENKLGGDAFDPVTDGDRAGEQAMRDLLKARVPEHGIIGEEYGDLNRESNARWLLDPIDGTRAFILGLPTWGTLIGFTRDGKPEIGVMNQPYTGERFWSDGTESYFRDRSGAQKQLRTRNATLETALVAATTPDMFAPGAEQDGFERVRGRARDCRYGTDCYAYSLLAAGMVDIVIEAGLKPHDIVALIPIIEQAGGRVTTWSGGSARDGGRVLACGDPAVHDACLALLNTA